MARTDARQAKRDARTARRRNQTRDEILDAACDIILRDGVSDFTLAAVAADLGLTNPALYYYFKSKEQVLAELCLREWLTCADEVESAVAETATGPEAVEALMRTVFGRYRDRLDMFLLVHTRVLELRDFDQTPEFLQRVRPANAKLYGRAEDLVAAGQNGGTFPRERSARRFVFTAHMAVIGLLNMKAITAAANDPLIHDDSDLIDDLCQTFRTAAGGPS